MKLQVKRLVGVKWYGVPIEELQGTSVIEYMVASTDTLMAAILEDDKPIGFISNDYKYVDQYKEKASMSVHAKDLQTLMVGTETLSLIAHVYPGSLVAEIEIVEDAA